MPIRIYPGIVLFDEVAAEFFHFAENQLGDQLRGRFAESGTDIDVVTDIVNTGGELIEAELYTITLKRGTAFQHCFYIFVKPDHEKHPVGRDKRVNPDQSSRLSINPFIPDK